MKPVAVAIFAHPDDESFGPGGTLALLSRTHDVYIITATGGEAGQCSIDTHHEELADIRKHELLESSKFLGIKKVYFLGYKDGMLSNNLYEELSSKIQEKLFHLQPEIVITFDKLGVSGHIDHITVSLATTFAVMKLDYSPQLWYYCVSEKEQEVMSKNYFVYFPRGYQRSKVDKIIDVSDVWDQRIKALQAHASQKHDGDRILSILDDIPKEEYFFIFDPQ